VRPEVVGTARALAPRVDLYALVLAGSKGEVAVGRGGDVSNNGRFFVSAAFVVVVLAVVVLGVIVVVAVVAVDVLDVFDVVVVM